MKKIYKTNRVREMLKLLATLFLFIALILGTQKSWATTTTVRLYASTATAVGGIATNTQQFIGAGAWQNNPAVSKMELPLPLTTLGQFTINQIEYIDNLSSIASAFSSFAKMPGNNPMEINLLDQIKTTLELFKNTDKVTFRVEWPSESKIIIYCDKEHLNGVFSNLFKNGIQSIPAGKDGLIDIIIEDA